MNKLFLLFAFTPSLLLAMTAQPIPEQVENKAWDAAKPPVMDEAKPVDTYSAAAWKRVLKAKPPKCNHGPIWKVGEGSLIEGTATKESTVGVKGKFTRFSAFGHEKKGQLDGAGSVDLASWDSGVPARDYRVMKYVFAVEEKNQSVLPFKFSVKVWNPKADAWESPVKLQFKFQKTPVELTFPAKIKKEGTSIRITSAESKRFTFLNPERMTAFAKLMELCNHHFLASFADVSLDLVLENTCTK